MFYFQYIANVPLAAIAPNMACRVHQQLQEDIIVWSKTPIIYPNSMQHVRAWNIGIEKSNKENQTFMPQFQGMMC
ncbi:hypothetical protein [Colwellia sp. MB02u-14]|uniref:hypothetical protein n=1 Tax=Colwellia sp. MB02u-14 TaxID=2759815 RepID=UPI0015F766FC|nr:hypothetical protein [Colwellia sp. MB02u-14]MBA6303317.1 hypothetical protein [Colwellia sp. MB02u-14]